VHPIEVRQTQVEENRIRRRCLSRLESNATGVSERRRVAVRLQLVDEPRGDDTVVFDDQDRCFGMNVDVN
jgi:hypothetical protein